MRAKFDMADDKTQRFATHEDKSHWSSHDFAQVIYLLRPSTWLSKLGGVCSIKSGLRDRSCMEGDRAVHCDVLKIGGCKIQL